MIRRAELSDISRMAEISVYGWRNTYRGIISDAELFINRQVDKTIERFKTSILDENRRTFVYQDETDQIIKAMFGLSDCRDEDKLSAYELPFIYVEKAFERQGIGKEIIAYFEAEGRAVGKAEYVIWVLEKNGLARRFYEKCGYKTDHTMKYDEKIEASEIRYCKCYEEARQSPQLG